MKVKEVFSWICIVLPFSFLCYCVAGKDAVCLCILQDTFVMHVLSDEVSLTVEGGVSLVGPHCPGTVRLLCEGVQLFSMWWTYNAGNFIETIEIDYKAPSSINLQNPAFITVDITNVTVDNIETDRANFSSVLTVNLLELSKQDVHNITCGDLTTRDTLQVNVKDYFTPNVTVSYISGILSRIEVYWANLVG